MKSEFLCRFLVCLLIHFPIICAACAQVSDQAAAKTRSQWKRPVTVSDCIEMTKFGDPTYYRGASSRGLVAQFSLDGKKFVVVLRKGNLAQNTNEYSLLLWRVDELFRLRSPSPELLLTMSSSSNREAIKSISWFDDNETLAFLGETPGQLEQIYTLNTETRILKRITNHVTSLLSYSIGPHGNQVAFVAEEPLKSIFNERARTEGILVSRQWLQDLIIGQNWTEGSTTGDDQLFFMKLGDPSRRLRTIGKISRASRPWLSPDGRHVVIATQVREIPESWKEYSDQSLHKETIHKFAEGEYSWLQRYELVDTNSGESRILLNAPIGTSGSEVAWSADSQSVVVSDTYLPLDGIKGEERKTRQSSTFAVEVKIQSGELVKVSAESLRLLTWDAGMNVLVFEADRSNKGPEPRTTIFFNKRDGKWQKLKEVVPGLARPEIVLKEDLNTPPKIFAEAPDTQQDVLLLDLNPQFKELKFAREEPITWKGSDGRDVKGGLYFPVDYVPGQKYPFVIQTHYFNPKRFWIDGPWTTAFAAQPLAGKNIAVLQVDESFADVDTPSEVDREVAAFEGAIDHLDRMGLIDRDRVGIIGFSRTNLFVLYALTHSKYHFAAASITDGVDGGYFQYMAFSNAGPAFARFTEGINGGAPFGQNLKTWLERSPSFSVDKIHTPLRIVGQNPLALLDQWEWFAALKRLSRPVEMVMMRDGDHILQKPWERMVSQQGNVDWFAFWLKGEEDPDPAKADQYARWRGLRKLQEENQKQSPAAEMSP